MCGKNVSNKQVLDEKTLYNGHLAHNVPWRERPTSNTYYSTVYPRTYSKPMSAF